ncbi:coiled-coil domain-containing protein 93-like [Montipora foliosa]|uniref:coiled-coil domain-containing protein 93-like n=1 Tax=Montipora foliosa TaxID=591990 RepID=UPI0035F13B89
MEKWSVQREMKGATSGTSRVTREFGGSRERTAGELVASLEKQIAVQEKKREQERSELISKRYEADKVKLGKIRFFQARKNREISSLQRKIDKVPSRAELTQYQRRFLELYKHGGDNDLWTMETRINRM